MIQQNYDTGEIYPQQNEEQIAAQFASFGKSGYDSGLGYNSQPPSITQNVPYYYGPQMYQPQQQNPYYYGAQMQNNDLWTPENLNPQMNRNMGNPALQQGPGGYNTNPYVGLGANPYYNGNYYGYQQPVQDITYHISPINRGSEYLPPDGYQEKIDELQRQYMSDMIKQRSQQTNNTYYNPYYYGANYYGNAYYNGYYNNNTYSEYQRKLEDMKREAQEARAKLNLQIAKAGYNYLGEQYDESKLEEMYLTGKTVTVPGSGQYVQTDYQSIMEARRFDNMVPFDNADYYRAKDAEVSREFHDIIPESANMAETFENMALVWSKWELDEEHEKRKNDFSSYGNVSSSTYADIMITNARRRAQIEREIDPNFDQREDELEKSFQELKARTLQETLSSLPTLNNFSKLDQDGTLHITYNPPQDFSNMTYNEEEKKYEESRQKFNAFIGLIGHTVKTPADLPRGGINNV